MNNAIEKCGFLHGESYFGLDGIGKTSDCKTNSNDYFWPKIPFLLETKTRYVMLPHPPPVFFLPDPIPKKGPDRNIFDTDFLGVYFTGGTNRTGCILTPLNGRRIEIYPHRIEDCANRMKNDPSSRLPKATKEILCDIVIIHEFMHALLHTGCPPRNYDIKSLKPDSTDVKDFLNKRKQDWNAIRGRLSPSPVLELHAQLGTWHIVNGDKDHEKVFLALMERQSQAYHIPKELFDTDPIALWGWMGFAHMQDCRKSVIPLKKMIKFLIQGGKPDQNLAIPIGADIF